MLRKKQKEHKSSKEGFRNAQAWTSHLQEQTRLAVAVQADDWALPDGQEEQPAQAVVVVVPDFQVEPAEHAAQRKVSTQNLASVRA
jgi:hypothetical protein